MTAASPAAPRPRPLMRPWAGMRRFLAWWSGELSDIAAARASRPRAWKVLFLRGEAGCEVYLRDRDRIERVGTSRSIGDRPFDDLRRRLGRQRIAPAETVLRLRPGEVVPARLDVPAAAGDVLEPILRNQIERLAPWPADKALLAWRTEPPSDGSTTLRVHLAIAGRSLVEGLAAELGSAGFAPGVVDYGTDAAAEPRMNLLAARSGESRRSGRAVLASVAVACLAALVAGAVGGVVLVQQTRELGALSARLDRLQSRVAATLPSQASLDRRARLVAQKGTQPSMAIVLEALSRALPDDAWLRRLEVERGVARLAGSAANAAALIGRIEASGHFTDVKFAAPTTTDGADRLESFTISAGIVPGRKLD